MVSAARSATFAIAFGAVALLGACNGSDSAAESKVAATDTSMTVGTTEATAAAAANAPATEPMTDGGIFGMLAAANQSEIDAGQLAESKATNTSVKSLARDIVAAHTEMRNNGEVLAKKLKITPDTTAAAFIRSTADSTASALNAAATGSAVDSAYVNSQVNGYEYVLDLIKRAENATQNTHLKSALKTDRSKVQSLGPNQGQPGEDVLAGPRGRDIDRVYLDGVERRTNSTLYRLIEAMRSTNSTDIKYLIQRTVPTFLDDMDRARALRKSF
ncbi:MAG: DUF4142 domain-containing protein [Gemmatimonadaceae bacterium]